MKKMLGCLAFFMISAILLAQELRSPDMLYFGATWCGPCRAMQPTIDAISKDYDVIKIDIDSDKETTRQYKVSRVPTIIIFKNGFEQYRYIGSTSEKTLRDTLEKVKK